jgi:hypothetical protein
VDNIDNCIGDLTPKMLRSDPVLSVALPASGRTVGEIIQEMKLHTNSAADSNSTRGGSALLEFLSRVPADDAKALQRGVKRWSKNFRFYQYNASITALPLATHTFPDGGAMVQMAARLSRLKRDGVVKIGQACQVARPPHCAVPCAM